MEKQMLRNGDFVKHFKFDLHDKIYNKTGLYSIITTGVIHSETKERMVLYQNIFSGLFYVRPY